VSAQRKKVRLAYGKRGLEIEVSADAAVIEPSYMPSVTEERATLLQAIRAPVAGPPLRERVRPGQTAAIVHTDITRATPNDRILPPLLMELENAGIARDDIVLINALGTHRRQTEQELCGMLGGDVVANYRCVQHDGHDDANLVAVGRTHFGHDVRVNRVYMEADIRILTGFIEPHFFAGFSGGPKGVLPSIAGAESVLDNHGADMIGHPKATWGMTRGNPIWEEMFEAACLTQPTFLLNVALNRDKQITGVFTGDLAAAHEAGRAFVQRTAMVPVDEPFDIVVTSNSGYPLDLNLYQAVKGLSAAAQIVRVGGEIIIAAECWDGVPDHGQFGRLLSQFASHGQALDAIQSGRVACMDQWQVQVLSMVRQKAGVHVYADGLTDDQIRGAMLTPCSRIEHTLEKLAAELGRPPRVCVLPEGPLTIPYVRKTP
jgi:nickel-dependent lactate racemase